MEIISSDIFRLKQVRNFFYKIIGKAKQQYQQNFLQSQEINNDIVDKE